MSSLRRFRNAATASGVAKTLSNQHGHRCKAAERSRPPCSLLSPPGNMRGKKMKRIAILIITLTISVSGRTRAEEPVFFTDPYLEYIVESQLGPDPTPTDMLDLAYLDAFECEIVDLGGIEYAVNLAYLDLGSNWIADISSLSGCADIRWLYLDNNFISNISSLSGLTDLRILSLDENAVADISSLALLGNLQTLWLYHNQVTDISALATLTNLTELDLDENSISDISALGALTGLEYLWLYNNQVVDIFPLLSLANLIELDLGSNHISDISAIALFTHLELLCLDDNPLNTPAYCTYLALLEANNPLTTELRYDPNPNPFTNDCSTNMAELGQWCSFWLDAGCAESNDFCSGADLDHADDLTLADFAQFARLWLRGR
jgi:hypothetical protein